MKLLCWNINSLVPTVRNAVLRHGSWLGFFQEHGLDIVCLQESKVPEDKLTKELCCVEGYQSFWATSREKKGYSGVTTYSCDSYAPLSCEVDCLGSGEDDIDREGRVVVTDHAAFVLVNVYVPNAGDRPDRPRLDFKLRFLEALKRKCDALAAGGRELLIVGDFNVPADVRDVHPDLLPGGSLDALYGPEERAALHALTTAYPDVWRRLHPEEAATFSVWNEKTSARAFNRGLRIDYVLCSPSLLEKVVSCEILSAEVLPPKWSDHAGMLLELRDAPPPDPHPPCPHWQRLHRRFVDTTQRSILGMFGKKRAAQPPATAAGAGAAAKTSNVQNAAPAPAQPAAEQAIAADGAVAQIPDGARSANGSRDAEEEPPSKKQRAAGSEEAAQGAPQQLDGHHQQDVDVQAADEQKAGAAQQAAGAASAEVTATVGKAEGSKQAHRSGGRGASASKSGRGKQQKQQSTKTTPEGGAAQRTLHSFFAAGGAISKQT